jgi:CspA family cold shock protein
MKVRRQMGRGREYRGGGKGRRPYEEDVVASAAASDRHQSRPLPRESLPAGGAAVDAIVKWFNPDKGFGFAEIADGSGDAFLHIKAVQALGQETLPSGAKLSVFVGQGQKGRQITKILSIDDSVVTLWPPSGAQSARAGNAPDASTAIDMLGTVKWFTLEKGMGFVEVDGGGKDVFVHISVVERAQLANLAGGQRVAMRVVETQKRRQAISITLAE